MKVIVQYSGGKDSQGSLIWAVNTYKKENVIAVFSDTGWESEMTYKHIKETTDILGVKLVTVRSKKHKNMLGMVKAKKRWMSPKARFCTEELKIIPFIDWLLDEHKASALIVQGIRANESAARSKMLKGCNLFKYYKVPYKYDKKGKAKYHSYRKKDVLKFLETYDDSIQRPMFNKTGQEVIDYIHENNQTPNPLYKMGMDRVGCFPCIMITQPQLKEFNKRFPERLQEIVKLELEFNSTFFSKGKIPKHACSNKSFPNMNDIIKYVEGKDLTIDMFETEENTSCMSYYNQCE
jgi:3'-phosphoadenosine 5'-phosphosulfate sulfotransferase (PAPS reductase)/FAD synthetase